MSDMPTVADHIRPDDQESEALGFSTYRSFTFIRDGVRQVLECSAQGYTSRKDIRNHTTLGTVQVEAMPRFAYAAGLTKPDGSLTDLGLTMVDRDPGLVKVPSQWLVHSKLSSRFSSGPTFWPYLMSYIVDRNSTDSEELRTQLMSLAPAAAQIGDRAIQYALTAFAGTYTKPECLGSLGILTEASDSDQGERRYLIGANLSLASPAVAGYVIADYWDHAWPQLKEVNLALFSEPSGPGSLLLMNSGEVGDMLKEMQNRGLVQLQRKTPPYQVFRSWGDTSKILEQVYE